MKLPKLLILTICTVSLLSSCAVYEPIGTTGTAPFSGANQIIGTSEDSLLFDKVINNLKVNGYTFEEIDRVNGFANAKPRQYKNYDNITMNLNVVSIKDGVTSKVILSGTFYQDARQGPDISGQVLYTKIASTSKEVFNEFVKQFDGIPNVTLTYKRI